jgi:misacylated tRNA(Ala) deacylase
LSWNNGETGVTLLLYLEDSYLNEFDATVVNVVDGAGVVLDQTAFYAGGGGQPVDTGILTFDNQSAAVTGMKRIDGQIVHLLAPDEPWPATGQQVHGTLNWTTRYQLMRTHTAMHVLCGTIFKDFGAQVTGGNMGPERARMDFELEDLSQERVEHIERRCNEVIAENRGVSWRTLPREEAFQIPDLIRTKINLLPEHIQEVRVVEIADLDLQADGGTHVRQTGEIGGLRIVGTRSKGKSNKRLEIEITNG